MHSEEIQYLTELWADCLLLAGRELVSVVGAGGKTSLIDDLAGELVLSGQRVITTTTTKIFSPAQGRVRLTGAPDQWPGQVSALVMPGERITFAASETPMGNGAKLAGLTPEAVDRMWLDGAAEYILVEADGSRNKPVKAPREHEPVIPAQSTVVIGLIGLSCLGRPVDGPSVFAAPELIALSGAEPGRLIDAALLADLICHENGLFKNAPAQAQRVVVLNQADDEAIRQAAGELLAELGRRRLGLRVVAASIRSGRRDIFDLAGED